MQLDVHGVVLGANLIALVRQSIDIDHLMARRKDVVLQKMRILEYLLLEGCGGDLTAGARGLLADVLDK